MADSSFNFSKLIDESKATIVNPKDYFSSMPKEGGLVEPIIKAAVYGLIAGVIYFIFTLLNISAFSTIDGGAFMALIGPIIFFNYWAFYRWNNFYNLFCYLWWLNRF